MFPTHEVSGNSEVNITSDDSKRWWENVDIQRIDQETRRSLLLKLKEKYPTSELLARLGIKSRATLTKHLKVWAENTRRARCPDA